MKVKIWGCRGSLPTTTDIFDYRDKLNSIFSLVKPEDVDSREAKQSFIKSLPFHLSGTFGGNSTCIEIRDKNNDLMIIDAGSGIRPLSDLLIKEDKKDKKNDYNIFFTHTHLDHICGFMFFVPLYRKNARLIFWSMYEDLHKRLADQLHFCYFPVDFDFMMSEKEFKLIKDRTPIHLNNLEIQTLELEHPGGSLGYRIIENGKVFVMLTDIMVDFSCPSKFDRYVNFIKDADLVFIDSQFTIIEMEKRMDHGHLCGLTATELCVAANVKKMIMFHHDFHRKDREIYDNCLTLMKYLKIQFPQSKLKIQPSFDGQSFNL